MEQKNISVILTTFNGAKYIEKQLDSILKQTLLPAEVIICDDNSGDNTVAILSKYANNSLIKVFVNERQLGFVQNFQQAAKRAEKGNWLVFADQDDIWIPSKLKRLADEMQLLDDGIKPALIYSDLKVINKNDTVIADSFWAMQKIYPSKINLSQLLYGNVATGCTIIINYPMAQEFFKMDNYNYLHDEWLNLIAYTFGKVKFLDEKLVLYRQHESNITFAEGFKPETGNSIKTIISYLTGKQSFLTHQFALANYFLLQYRDKLTGEQIKVIEKFIKQEHKNYLLQRINRRITYK